MQSVWAMEDIGLGIASGAAVAGAIYYCAKKVIGSRADAVLNPNEYREFNLVDRKSLSHNVRLFRFALPKKSDSLNLPVGKHIYLQAEVEGEVIARPYTPTSSNDDLGYFELLIKVYPQGLMSQHLDHLPIGSAIRAKGPLGRFSYEGEGRYHIATVKGRSGIVKRFGMLAGGTGITPMLQIIRAVLKNERDFTEISLVFGNVEERDILLRDELLQYEESHKQFSCYHTLNNAPEGWKQGVGFVTAEMISTHCPPPSPDTMILLCGPAPFTNAMKKVLTSLSYTNEMIFKF